MENTIFARLPFDPIYLIAGMAVVIVIMLIMLISTMAQQSRLVAQYRSFMKGRDGATLEGAFTQRFEDLDKVLHTVKRNERNVDELHNMLSANFQKMGIQKYDAFQEKGAKLSFALTLLDENNCGFILNSMHAHEGCYTYIKEIVNGESFVALSEEEVESLHKAITAHNYFED